MGCLTLAGYSKGCDASHGGIKTIALFEKAGLDIDNATITTGEITGLDMTSDLYSGFTYDFLIDNTNWTQPVVGDGILASVHWTPNINLIFRKMSNTLRNEIYELSKGDLCAIVKDYNDVYWFLGYERGLRLVASTGSQSGSKLEELNGETLLLAGMESQPAYTIDISSGSTVDASILALFGF